MADDDYRRLTSACGCSSLLPKPQQGWGGARPGSGPKKGREPQSKKLPPAHSKCPDCGVLFDRKRFGRGVSRCDDCRRPVEKPAKPPPLPRMWKEPRQCPACRGFFTPKKNAQYTCGRPCRMILVAAKREKPKFRIRCPHCGAEFMQTTPSQKYCSRKCKMMHWQASNPDFRDKYAKPQTVCVHIAKFCESCGEAGSSRREWTICTRCRRLGSRRKFNAIKKESSKSDHRSAAKEYTCKECSAVFCPLYGFDQARLCVPCAKDRQKANSLHSKLRRDSRLKAEDSESVNPYAVFARDSWECQICGVATPRSKRGTYDDDAPELDHIVPLSKGGAHTYTNTQCACRRCNGEKGASTTYRRNRWREADTGQAQAGQS